MFVDGRMVSGNLKLGVAMISKSQALGIIGAFLASLVMWDGLFAVVGVAGADWAWSVVQWSPIALLPLVMIFLYRTVR